jgi:hypothetical protein
MGLNQLTSTIRRGAKENSSVILSVAAGIGTISTAYLAAVAGYRTAQRLEGESPYDDFGTRARLVWRLYIPAGTSAIFTIGCIASVNRVDARKTLAAQTALAVAQRTYSEYRDQVIEELGEKRDQKIVAKVAENRANKNPASTIVLGSGDVLCCEMFTGRYFMSDMQSLHKAVNDLNARLLKHDYATLDDFYYLIGLEPTMSSGHAGWKSDKLLELEFSSIIHNEKPCLAFDYNYVKAF